MLRDTVSHEICHAKLWMDNCREEESYGPEFSKTCNTVANHFEIIGRPLHFRIKALKLEKTFRRSLNLCPKRDVNQKKKFAIIRNVEFINKFHILLWFWRDNLHYFTFTIFCKHPKKEYFFTGILAKMWRKL
jgi:hypothetical protein